MRNFTDGQLHLMMDALATYAESQRDQAAAFEGKLDRLPEDMQSIPAGLLENADLAESMRSDAAGEMHHRGRTSCDLAHPGRPCSLQKVAERVSATIATGKARRTRFDQLVEEAKGIGLILERAGKGYEVVSNGGGWTDECSTLDEVAECIASERLQDND